MVQKIYVVRKYIVANSVIEALQKERTQPVDDCWAEESTHKEHLEELSKKNPIGFQSSPIDTEKPSTLGF